MSANNLVVNRDKLQFTMTRVFNAAPPAIWKVLSDPTLIPRWWGPAKYKTVVDKCDFRVGGVWRFVQTAEDGGVHAFNGVFKLIEPEKRMSYTFEYEPFPGHISTDTLVLEPVTGGKTRLTATTTFTNLEDLDGMLQAGMEGGAVESWDRLEALAASLVASA